MMSPKKSRKEETN